MDTDKIAAKEFKRRKDFSLYASIPFSTSDGEKVAEGRMR